VPMSTDSSGGRFERFSFRGRFESFFFRGFSGESLALLRIYFGIGLLFFHISQFVQILGLDPTGPRFRFLEPMWHFQLLGIESHLPIATPVAFVILMAATVMMIFGKWTRSSILIVIVMIFYMKGVRDSFTGDVHHRYLVPTQMLFLLLISKCGAFYSADARKRRPEVVEEWQASWPIKAMQVYCASFYFWSILAKLRVSGWNWFAGGGRIQSVLMDRSIMWGTDGTGQALDNTIAYQLAQMPELLTVLACGTFVLEAGFPLVLVMRSTKARLIFLAGVTAFHVANALLMYVNFLMIPIVFLVFFDLVPLNARVLARVRSFRSTPRSPPAAA
jgi:hypothetical protein